MAAPATPTSTTIAVEGLKKAGYLDPSSEQSALVTRAIDEWIEEIKWDIWNMSKKLTSLQKVGVVVTVQGRSRYSFPSDFSSLIGMTLMEGATTGTAQAGASASITLASTDTSTTDIEGKEIINTTQSEISQIYDFNTSTKVATVYPAWTTTPVNTDSYLVVDTYTPLREHPSWNFDKEPYPMTNEKPCSYFPISDSEFMVINTPDKVYGIKLRYYADLLELDLAGTTYSNILKRWRNVFVNGIWAKALIHQDDGNAAGAMKIYENNLRNLSMREEYGKDLSDLGAVVREPEC